mmetsp:Transcript_39922/g.94008  ORF Transcript_39922/g.94008 Transcript_39922/m.94008 type:complete len:225 (-) Transcript_39922:280-954(-)
MPSRGARLPEAARARKPKSVAPPRKRRHQQPFQSGHFSPLLFVLLLSRGIMCPESTLLDNHVERRYGPASRAAQCNSSAAALLLWLHDSGGLGHGHWLGHLVGADLGLVRHVHGGGWHHGGHHWGSIGWCRVGWRWCCVHRWRRNDRCHWCCVHGRCGDGGHWCHWCCGIHWWCSNDSWGWCNILHDWWCRDGGHSRCRCDVLCWSRCNVLNSWCSCDGGGDWC